MTLSVGAATRRETNDGSVQRSFDDLGTPLRDVTFCVIDLETTGGSAADCGITEIGAVKVRGGECLGTFQTMINPGCAIPPTITMLTGITESMVMRAPRIESVLPTLLEFIGTSSVIVGHNIRFDVGFLDAALVRDDRPRLSNLTVDTVALARRLLRDEVPNCRLGTLAERLRLPHRPSHRALDDALATADLLHVLIERAGGLGVSGLDDLRILPTIAGSAQLAKLRLTDRLPRTPGVYLFRDHRGRVLYVGKATNLRARVRQYFSSDDRRKVGALLRETERIDHKRCDTTLEAAVLEIRLIHALRPRFNRQANRFDQQVYVKLTLRERYPRLSVVREPRDDGAHYVGPLPSRRFAGLVVEAIQTAVPLRRCTARVGRGRRSGPCIPAQLGVAMCPCAGDIDASAYAEVVATTVAGLSDRPALLLEPLLARMHRLAEEERFEEAALTRDRTQALAESLRRQRRFDQLRSTERLVVRHGEVAFELRRGRLTHVWEGMVARPTEAQPPDPGPLDDGPLPMDLADELLCLSRWLDQQAGRVAPARVEGVWSSPLNPIPTAG
jgi:DNA polymerase-3 subunit epsilon